MISRMVFITSAAVAWHKQKNFFSENYDLCVNYFTKLYSETCQTSKINCFAIIIKSFEPFTNLANRSILDVWKGSEHNSALGY